MHRITTGFRLFIKSCRDSYLVKFTNKSWGEINCKSLEHKMQELSQNIHKLNKLKTGTSQNIALKNLNSSLKTKYYTCNKKSNSN
jgi:hypothetical protein